MGGRHLTMLHVKLYMYYHREGVKSLSACIFSDVVIGAYL